MKRPLYQAIAQALQAKDNCLASHNWGWYENHSSRLADLVNRMPSGSGIDSGTQLDEDSTPKKLIFTLGYHHMNEGGSYDGWTYHKVIVTPSLAQGFDLRITGRNHNQIKDYLGDTYYEVLSEEIEG